MNPNRICVKLFAAETPAAKILDCVPVFHKWIQKRNVSGHLLIDVADYSHVWQGPGIMLVAHEANFSTDQSAGRLGLLYQSKRPMEGDFEARVGFAIKAVAAACVQLETDLPGKIKFLGNEIQVSLNDRLAAPSDQEALKSMESELTGLLAKLYPGESPTVEGLADGKSRPTITVRSAQPIDVKTLLERLA
jgi:hypothetical protein